MSIGKNLLMNFGDFKPERLNQRISRMVLSVHKKASTLAVLGELGRYPLLVKALVHTFKYEWMLGKKSHKNSLIALAYTEMCSFAAAGTDCWLTRVNKMKNSLGISVNSSCSQSVANKHLKNQVEGKFQVYWLDSIKQVRLNQDGRDQNKLRLYKTFKGSFNEEPYITQVVNRNQNRGR